MDDTWRGLRGLRAAPPAAASTDDDRRLMFQASLEQCEQFVNAARDAGYATRGLQLFYAMQAAGSAIAAVSPRLSSAELATSTHGLKVIRSSPTLAGITVTPTNSNGDFTKVAKALGEPSLNPGDSITLGQLWPLILGSRVAGLEADPPFPGLAFAPEGPGNGLVVNGWVEFIPESVKQRIGNDRAKILEFLGHYPALRGLDFTAPGGGGLAWKPSSVPGRWQLHMRMAWEVGGVVVPQIQARFAAAGLPGEWLVANPVLGTMSEQLHPLLVWWAVMIAVSSLTRYEPVKWAAMVDIDSAAEANAIEHLLDEAVMVIPYLVWQQLDAFA